MRALETWIAHGVGTRSDLPLPVGWVITAAVLALLASFAALAMFWQRPRFDQFALQGRPAPRLVQFIADGWPARAARYLVLALFLFLVLVGFTGDAAVPKNPLPWAFYITFWVGLIPLSLLLGPVWAGLNPLRTLAELIRPYARALQAEPKRSGEVLRRWGYRPAALSLLAFLWLELAAPDRANPRFVATWIVVYSVVHIGFSLRFGAQWFFHGEGFEVLARLLGAASVWGRDGASRVVWRSPGANLASLARRPGLTPLLLILLGSTAFDGVTRTRWWQLGPALTGEVSVVVATVTLTACIGVLSALYALGVWATARLSGVTGLWSAYAHALIPIAAGYAIAHYYSMLVFDGQLTWILLSDPWASGLNLLGLTGYGVNYFVISTGHIAAVQALAIIGGHVAAVLLTHDQHLAVGQRAGLRLGPVSQLPLLAVMVALTAVALTLLLGM